MREPRPSPACGKFGARAPATVAVPPRSKRIENAATRGLAMLSSHGPLALKLYVMLWVAALAASVFVILKA